MSDQSNGVASDLLGKLGKQPKKPAQKINVLAVHPRNNAPGPTVGSLLEKSRTESDGAPRAPAAIILFVADKDASHRALKQVEKATDSDRARAMICWGRKI